MRGSTDFTTETLHTRVVLRRRIHGISAVLLPFRSEGRPDWEGFAAHVERTLQAGLTPAVNMDTGYVNLLTAGERRQVLSIAQQVTRGQVFIAGAFVEGDTGDLAGAYGRQVEEVRKYGGRPILFPCSRLKALDDREKLSVYRAVARSCGGPLLAFELGAAFASFGFIFGDDLVRGIVETPEFVGLKHSSLRRETEWRRLALRDEVRPDFRIYTGNDLAIDMVVYGSDYLLGLSTFAPDAFALRDALWEQGDASFYELNDLLQYLGQFAFRRPTPAYKHSAAQFLYLRGQIRTEETHPASPRRPTSDRVVLDEILRRLEETMASITTQSGLAPSPRPNGC
ncbi:MAG TPA: dihydrodipicolinate synthase family protein [Firmicutes bacterium]|nr:dihydrodipicolinate synthase family protein [Bacillota bacterium]